MFLRPRLAYRHSSVTKRRTLRPNDDAMIAMMVLRPRNAYRHQSLKKRRVRKTLVHDSKQRLAKKRALAMIKTWTTTSLPAYAVAAANTSHHFQHDYKTTKPINKQTMAPLIEETNYYLDSPSTSFERPKSSSSKKSVSFSSDLYLIPHAKDLKRKEKEAYSWMTKHDLRRVERENVITLHSMSEGHFPVTKKQYFRGLESLMPEAQTKRNQRIHFVVNAILREQKTKRSLNDQWLEEFAKLYTSKSAQAAYNKGSWDAAEATREDNVKITPEVWI